MSDVEIHTKAAREKRLASLEEFDKKRYMVVGDLAIKTVEQAIEAVAGAGRKAFSLTSKKCA
jgi:hypothetical protein